MRVRYPKILEDFSCIAGACPDSCCKEWDVLVDEATAARYQTLPGELGDAIRGYLRQDEDGDWYFAITEGRCPMWRQDGLCRIQAALSHDALCATCREFPRLSHDYGDFLERGLALSCPVAADLILSGPHQMIEQEIPGGEEGDYDSQDMALLLKTRKVMLTILEDSAYSVPQALALGLLYGYHAQNLLDGGEERAFEAVAELEFARGFAKKTDIGLLPEFYLGLEILTAQWDMMLRAPRGGEEWDEKLRLLAIYGIERYWLQAISDFDLVGRVKLVVVSCLLISGLGGDFVQTAQLYSKEIENDADNVEAILDGAYSSPALTDAKLLGLLLK